MSRPLQSYNKFTELLTEKQTIILEFGTFGHILVTETNIWVRQSNEPTCRCQSNPLIGALGIQEPVIPGEPLIKG